MPITGSVDLSAIIPALGDPHHGLKEAGPEENQERQQLEHIYRATYGPVDISTSMTLAVIHTPIFDVNKYYRSLNIPWPYTPTKKELRLGYQRVDGPNSEKLTYFFKQLLDPATRKRYDEMPPGSHFYDKYSLEEDMRKLSDLAGRLSSTGEGPVSTADLISEHEEDIKAFEARKKALELKPIRDTWAWGYYLLKSRKYEYVELIDWLMFLTIAHVRKGIEHKISIGFVGETEEPFLVKKWQGKNLFLLTENQSPSLELAETAVSKMLLP